MRGTHRSPPGSAGRWGAGPGSAGPGSSHCARWGPSRLLGPGGLTPRRAPAATPPAGKRRKSGDLGMFPGHRRSEMALLTGAVQALLWGTFSCAANREPLGSCAPEPWQVATSASQWRPQSRYLPPRGEWFISPITVLQSSTNSSVSTGPALTKDPQRSPQPTELLSLACVPTRAPPTSRCPSPKLSACDWVFTLREADDETGPSSSQRPQGLV